MTDFNNESVLAIEETLNQVDSALERLRVGSYRNCEVCATPLDQTELVKNPLLARCRDHLDQT